MTERLVITMKMMNDDDVQGCGDCGGERISTYLGLADIAMSQSTVRPVFRWTRHWLMWLSA
jgi:hypothetical protein